MPPRIRIVISVVAALAGAACGDLTAPPDPIGSWGGEHLLLVVTAAGGTAEFDCAHGSFVGALAPSSDGRFAVTGVWVRDHGGPVRDGEILPTFPASYAGRISGPTMDITVTRTDSAITVGTYTLTKGVAGSVFKCL